MSEEVMSHLGTKKDLSPNEGGLWPGGVMSANR